MANLLRVAHVAVNVVSLGPGKRLVLWVQGCCFACKGCSSPQWRPLEAGTLHTVDTLAHDLLTKAPHDTEGVTFSGGEPMLQAGPLLLLWEKLKCCRPHWSLILYTGFTWEDVLRAHDPAQRQLAQAADVLIDGPYLEHLNNGRGLRGSSNQRIRFISPRYLSLARYFHECPRTLELVIGQGRVSLIGIPEKGLPKAMSAVLAGTEPSRSTSA